MKKLCLSLCLLLATSGSLHAQEKSQEEMQRSCRTFVQRFYDWYVPKLRSGGYLGTALRYKKDAFSPELFQLLKLAQGKGNLDYGEIDWDPFIKGQDVPGPGRFVAGKVKVTGDHCWVDVDYLATTGRSVPKDMRGSIVAELMHKEDRLHFVNFLYPKESDLLSSLKALQEERRKHAKKPD